MRYALRDTSIEQRIFKVDSKATIDDNQHNNKLK